MAKAKKEVKRAVKAEVVTPKVEKKEAPKKQQRLVAERNIDKRKALGWKVIREGNAKDLHAGARGATSDLVLMEK